jgi:hypothetical protein
LANVRPGDPVEIRPEPIFQDRSAETSQPHFAGQITFVDVKIEPVSSKVLVWAEVHSAGAQLHDGQSVAMTINP